LFNLYGFLSINSFCINTILLAVQTPLNGIHSIVSISFPSGILYEVWPKLGAGIWNIDLFVAFTTLYRSEINIMIAVKT